MKIAGICFTENGFLLLERVTQILRSEGHEMTMHFKSRFADKHKSFELKEDLREWIGKRFVDSEALVFIGAVGITTRSIAPFVRDKRQDPAVIVIDDGGRFCIPLLSGHIGGANELAKFLAGKLSAVPVITTSTDINSVFAVDTYAAKHQMTLSSMTYAKEVSASLLSGYPVGFASDLAVSGRLPKGFLHKKQMKAVRPDEVTLGIYISPFYKDKHFDHCLWLIPKCITVGIGCRKGTTCAQIEEVVNEVLKNEYIYPEAIARVATIELKSEELGLLSFCKKAELPLISYTADELKEVEGDFTKSDFVKEVTGVDNVCERSAFRAGDGFLIAPKTAKNGVTVAMVLHEETISFE